MDTPSLFRTMLGMLRAARKDGTTIIIRRERNQGRHNHTRHIHKRDNYARSFDTIRFDRRSIGITAPFVRRPQTTIQDV